MSPELTAHTGMDAIVHSFEAYVSNASSPVTDIQALESIRLMKTFLPLAYHNPGTITYRYQTMLGSLLAGLAFSNASLGAVHAMAHSLGGLLDLPHGECNAMLLDHVINFNFDVAPERYRMIAEAMGIDSRGFSSKELKDRLITSVFTLKHEVGIRNQLRQRGVKTSDISELSKKAIKDACMLTNPRKAAQRDIELIYEEAM